MTGGSQVNIKSNYIDTDDVSGTAEISDFVVEAEVFRNNLTGSAGPGQPTTRKSKKLIKKVLSMSEQVDEFIDQCIEIESNKKMFQENVKWFTLSFKSADYENMACFFSSSRYLQTLTFLLSPPSPVVSQDFGFGFPFQFVLRQCDLALYAHHLFDHSASVSDTATNPVNLHYETCTGDFHPNLIPQVGGMDSRLHFHHHTLHWPPTLDSPLTRKFHTKIDPEFCGQTRSRSLDSEFVLLLHSACHIHYVNFLPGNLVRSFIFIAHLNCF